MFNKSPKKLVMAFGTFDLFHAGHENYLNQAKSHGDSLIVVIARDTTVKQIKGEHPLNSEKKRAKAVNNSGIPDKVVLGNHRDKHHVLKKYRPDVIALGYDQVVFTQKIQKTLIDLKLDAEIVRLTPFFPHVYKSSLLKEKLKNPTSKDTLKKTPLTTQIKITA